MSDSESCLTSADDGGCPVGYPQFGEDVGHVVADGLVAEHETCRDVGVAPSGGDEVENLVFAGGQFGEHGDDMGRTWRGEELDDPLRHGGAEDGLPAADRGDGTDDLGLIGPFEQ